MDHASQVTMMAMHAAIIAGIVYRIWRGEQTHRVTKETELFLKNGRK